MHYYRHANITYINMGLLNESYAPILQNRVLETITLPLFKAFYVRIVLA